MDLVDPGPDPTWRTVDVTIHFGYGRFPKYESVRLTSESLCPVLCAELCVGGLDSGGDPVTGGSAARSPVARAVGSSRTRYSAPSPGIAGSHGQASRPRA